MANADCLRNSSREQLQVAPHGYPDSDILRNSPEGNISRMPVESIPKFTAQAAKLWDSIPADTRKLLLSNVWCGDCRHEVTITNFSGTVKGGDLLLVGKCAECLRDVARLIESSK